MLTELQIRISDRVLDEESAARDHVVIALSGAHAYGFPSPDSDLDLKAVHVEKTARLLGFQPGSPTRDRMEVIEGVEIDYTSNELGGVLIGILAGNGNYLERVLGPIAVRSSAEHQALRPLAARSVSKKLHRHYRGFARGQLHEFDQKPTAKKLLYVLRTALTGVHALRTGEIDPNLTHLIDEDGFGEARELIERKKTGERVELEPAMKEKWRHEVERAFVLLDEALQKSPLPDEAPNVAELEAWLLEVRRRRF